MREHEQNPSRRFAQHKLAKEVLNLVHGQETAEQAQQEHLQLFSHQSQASTQASGFSTTSNPSSSRASTSSRPSSATPTSQTSTPVALPPPSLTLPRSLIKNVPLSKLLYHAALVDSKTQGHHYCASGAAYIGSIGPENQLVFTRHDSNRPRDSKSSQSWEKSLINDNTLVLRVGKRKVKIVRIVDDAEFLAGKEFSSVEEW